jgi:hypothetical protein
MKINGIFSGSALKHNTTFKGSVIDFRTGAAVKEEHSPVIPEYYQNLYGIEKPSYKTSVLLKSGERIPLIMDNSTIRECLSDKDGCPDSKLVKKFISLYQETLQNMTDQNEKEAQLFREEKQENPNIIDFDTSQEQLESALLNELQQSSTESGYEFSKNILSQISGRHKKELSAKLLESIEEEKEFLPSDAYKRTKKLFELSKTPDGYDFSDLDKKNDFINAMDSIIAGYGIDDEDDLYKQFLNNAKDKKGKTDWDYAIDASKVVRSLSFFEPLNYVFSNINYFCSKDIKNKDKILNTIIQINRNSNYGMDSGSTDFETIMELCFDKDNKFSQKRADLLFKKFKEADEWVETQEDLDNCDFERYRTILSYSANMLSSYFDAITDKKGKLNAQKISFKDFVNSSNISFF